MLHRADATFLEALKSRPGIAHQGGPEEDGPGNTMLEFKRAVDLGYLVLETDVRATAGGEAVLMHDPYLPDEDQTLVASLSVADRKAVERSGQPLVLLDDFLDFLNQADAFASIDAKKNEDRPADEDDPVVALYLDALRRHKAKRRVCLASFSDHNEAQLRAGAKGAISTLAALETFNFLRDLEDPDFSPEYKGKIVSVPPSGEVPVLGYREVNEAFVAGAHDRGLLVGVWTINEADEMNRLFDLGVDTIYSDRLRVLKGVLQARRMWN